ncbi:hypothetical protein SLI_4721 [Streptomyces lividans 1326]|uniref:Uncharacterized protein n=1 Tax=Streptomyces lividans 1326 TaxID=1200984 RepID=A0A7U9DSS2_STRLI|nr:hypothetical protein SLI_4721 [Streptomyces lividans 1326]
MWRAAPRACADASAPPDAEQEGAADGHEAHKVGVVGFVSSSGSDQVAFHAAAD